MSESAYKRYMRGESMQMRDPTETDLTAWLDEVEARCDAARKMVVALCKPRRSVGAREWLMSIPARPDYDPDLVIGDSLADLPRALEVIRATVPLLKRARDDLKAWDQSYPTAVALVTKQLIGDIDAALTHPPDTMEESK